MQAPVNVGVTARELHISCLDSSIPCFGPNHLSTDVFDLLGKEVAEFTTAMHKNHFFQGKRREHCHTSAPGALAQLGMGHSLKAAGGAICAPTESHVKKKGQLTMWCMSGLPSLFRELLPPSGNHYLHCCRLGHRRPSISFCVCF